MKKLLVILLAMTLLVFVGCVSVNAAEKAEPKKELVYESFPSGLLPLTERLPGEWYAEYQGRVISLSGAQEG